MKINITMPLQSGFEQNFPSYQKDFSVEDVQVYWYHPDFTQSRYPPGQRRSEACTLICLLVAQRICQAGLQLRSVEDCPIFGSFIAESIVEGNKTHARIRHRGLVPHPYLTIDEALTFGGRNVKALKEWKFQVFQDNIKKKLCHNILKFANDWYKQPKADTLIMLLVTCGRTILFIFQQKVDRVSLFDSHSHMTTTNPNRGLVVAQVKLRKLHRLCDWYLNDVLHTWSNARADRYELAFLYH